MPEIDFATRVPWLLDLFVRMSAEGARLLVAFDTPTPLGHDDQVLQQAVPCGFVLFDPQRQWLEQILVAPRAQGSALASTLIAAVKTACPQGFGLDVNADNDRARRFYAREGLQEIGIGQNPRSGLPIVILRWQGGF